MAGSQLHEDYRREHTGDGGSDRSFGLTFAVLFAAIALWPLVRHQPVRPLALIAAAVLGLVSFVSPSLLNGPKRLWMKLALLLARITNPVVTTLLYVLAIVPLGCIRRWLGKDSLDMRKDPTARSYWIVRTPPGPDPTQMTAQF